MLPLLVFWKVFPKVISIVFLDSIGIIFQSMIQLMADEVILDSFKLMKPYSQSFDTNNGPYLITVPQYNQVEEKG